MEMLSEQSPFLVLWLGRHEYSSIEYIYTYTYIHTITAFYFMPDAQRHFVGNQ